MRIEITENLEYESIQLTDIKHVWYFELILNT